VGLALAVVEEQPRQGMSTGEEMLLAGGVGLVRPGLQGEGRHQSC
jgi:hypothetical protein